MVPSQILTPLQLTTTIPHSPLSHNFSLFSLLLFHFFLLFLLHLSFDWVQKSQQLLSFFSHLNHVMFFRLQFISPQTLVQLRFKSIPFTPYQPVFMTLYSLYISFNSEQILHPTLLTLHHLPSPHPRLHHTRSPTSLSHTPPPPISTPQTSPVPELHLDSKL